MIAQAAVRVFKGVDAGLLGAPLLPHPRVDEDAVLANLEIEAARGEPIRLASAGSRVQSGLGTIPNIAPPSRPKWHSVSA